MDTKGLNDQSGENKAFGLYVFLGIGISLFVVTLNFLLIGYFFIELLTPSVNFNWLEYTYKIEGLATSVAFLIVFTPALFYLSKKFNSFYDNVLETPFKTFSLSVLAVLFGICTIMILFSLVFILLGFLNGDLTLNALLDFAFTILVAGSLIYYYRKVTKNYWKIHPAKHKIFTKLAALLVLVMVVVSIFILDPVNKRTTDITHGTLINLDQTNRSIGSFYAKNGNLPSSLEELETSNVYYPDADERFSKEVRYLRTSNFTFSLCTTFENYPRRTDLPEYPYEIFEVTKLNEEICYPLTINSG